VLQSMITNDFESVAKVTANFMVAVNTRKSIKDAKIADEKRVTEGQAINLLEQIFPLPDNSPKKKQLIAQLTALPAVQSADQQIIDQLAGVNSKLTTTNSSIGTTNSSLGTANSSLSGIGSSTSTSNTKLDAANAYLASIDTNGDGIITTAEIQAAALNNIKAAQADITTATQSAATNTGATKTSVDASKTAIDANTAKADEVKGEVTANNAISVQIQQLNETLTAAATSSSGGFMALGAMLLDANHRHAAIAFNTKNSRPASTVDGVEWAANGLAFARLGIPDIVSSPTLSLIHI
jgi:hypothetical protein